MILPAVAIGALVGLLLGVTGAGGSILALPLLTLALHWSVAQAAPVSSLAVGCASLLGALLAFREGQVRYKTAAMMALAGFVTTPFGVLVAQHAPHRALSLGFSAVLIYVACTLFIKARGSEKTEPPHADPVCTVDPATGRVRWTIKCAVILALGGLGTGFLAGLLGVGAGFIIVPVLRRVTAISMHMIVATSLLVIALISGSAVVAAMAQHVAIDWSVAIPFVGASLAGMLAGRRLAAHLGGARLQQAFALLLLVMAGIMAVTAIEKPRVNGNGSFAHNEVRTPNPPIVTSGHWT